MRRLLLPCVALLGCSFRPGNAGSDAAHTIDAARDTLQSDVIEPAQMCFTAEAVAFTVCLARPPTGEVTLTTKRYDTSGSDCGAALGSNSAPACALVGSAVTIAAAETISASGDAPLVVIATDSIDVRGTIDVASHRTGSLAGQIGAMADPAGCGGTPPADLSSGGGAGGSYATTGGNGGDGAPPGSHGAAGALVGVALRGGCAGQSGNATGDTGTPGAGGHGGGVVVLIAPTITFEGTAVLDASGEGGGGADIPNTDGGGGGGAGGLIALQASMIAIGSGAEVFANGGGGGGGTQSSQDAGSGGDPASANAAAAGGAAAGESGSGGAGFFTDGGGTAHAAVAGGPETNPTDGGGGGGGGAGYVVANGSAAVSGSGSVSPALSR